MGHFYNRFSDNLYHSANKQHAEYGTKNSTSSEKGKDGKKNNTSEYNHEYYEENKDKWKDNKSSKSNAKSDNDNLYYDKDGKARFGHKDYDENDEDFKRTDGDVIPGTDLRTFTNKNGSTIIMGKGIKFSFPPGTKITADMAKKIAAVEKSDKSNKEQYIAKMLNSVTGFADKQGLFGKSGKKGSGSGSKKSGKGSTSSSKSSSNETSEWDQKMGKYNGKGGEAAKKTSQQLKDEAQARGISQTNRGKNQKKKKTKQNSQFMHANDLGSIFIKDLY